jgi:hypothetical protein
VPTGAQWRQCSPLVPTPANAAGAHKRRHTRKQAKANQLAIIGFQPGSTLPLGTNSFGDFGKTTQVYASSTSLFGVQTYCPGYGLNTATQAQCTANFGGSGIGVQRSHLNSASAVPGDSNRLGYFDNGSAQNWAAGDSGGTCSIFPSGTNGLLQKSLGPLGYFGNPTCRNYVAGAVNNGWGATRLDAVHPIAWREAIYDALTNAIPNTADPFTSNTLAQYKSYGPPSGATANWSWSSVDGGCLMETNNAGVFVTGAPSAPGITVGRGAIKFFNQPMFDGYVVSRFNSTTSNAASVILRAVDQDNYYKFEVNKGLNQARVIRVSQGVFTVLSSSTLPAGFAWTNSPWITFGVVGNSLFGYIDNVNLPSTNVVDDDPNANLTAGIAGFEVVQMGTVKVHDFFMTNW